jgi:hypothetical protein
VRSSRSRTRGTATDRARRSSTGPASISRTSWGPTSARRSTSWRPRRSVEPDGCPRRPSSRPP